LPSTRATITTAACILAIVAGVILFRRGREPSHPSAATTEAAPGATQTASPAGGRPAATPTLEGRRERPAPADPRGPRAGKAGALPSFVADREGRAATAAAARPGGDPGTRRFGPDAAGISAALQDALPQVKECYDAWLKVNPSLGGKVVVGFTLSRSKEAPDEGRISKATIAQSSLGHTAMEGCVLSVVDDLRFDAPADDVEVEFPLVMSARDQPEDGSRGK
jgi:hypothetical protein